MMQPKEDHRHHLCSTCGDANGEVFVACHECRSPICRACFDDDVKEGRKVCLQCGTAYDGIYFTWISMSACYFGFL